MTDGTKRKRAEIETRMGLIELRKPFVQMKCDILNVSLPTITLHPDGRVENTYSPEVERELERIELLWAESRDAFLASAGKLLEVNGQ